MLLPSLSVVSFLQEKMKNRKLTIDIIAPKMVTLAYVLRPLNGDSPSHRVVSPHWCDYSTEVFLVLKV